MQKDNLQVKDAILYIVFLRSLFPKQKILDLLPEESDTINDIYEYSNYGDHLAHLYEGGSIDDDHLNKRMDILEKVITPKRNRCDIIKMIKESNKPSGIKGLNRLFDYVGPKYGELVRCCDCRNMILPKDLPMHAKIIVGSNPLDYYISEQQYLTSALYLLSKGFFFKKILEKYFQAHIFLGLADHPKMYGTFIQTFAKMAIIEFFNFIEAFVNSVGLNYKNEQRDVKSEISMWLDGKYMTNTNQRKQRKYKIPLTGKLSLFPEIIRDNNPNIGMQNDFEKKYRYEKDFIRIKTLRNNIVHNKDDVDKIVNPLYYLNEAHKAYYVIGKMALDFWGKCYSDSKLTYIRIFDQRNIQRGLDFVKYEHSIIALEVPVFTAEDSLDVKNEILSFKFDENLPPA